MGLERLDGKEVNDITSMSSQYLEKLDREIKSDELILDIKLHSPTGKRKEYRLLGKIVFGSDILTAEANDWDFKRTIHKLFNKLLNEVKHKFKTEGHLPKA